MKKIAFLFDGQGAFRPGIGKELFSKYSEVKGLIEKASVYYTEFRLVINNFYRMSPDSPGVVVAKIIGEVPKESRCLDFHCHRAKGGVGVLGSASI